VIALELDLIARPEARNAVWGVHERAGYPSFPD
jgi:hypothetical protein